MLVLSMPAGRMHSDVGSVCGCECQARLVYSWRRTEKELKPRPAWHSASWSCRRPLGALSHIPSPRAACPPLHLVLAARGPDDGDSSPRWSDIMESTFLFSESAAPRGEGPTPASSAPSRPALLWSPDFPSCASPQPPSCLSRGGLGPGTTPEWLNQNKS